MALACKFCIMGRGLKGSEVGSLPQTEEELLDHIEREHHIPVRREHETKEEASARFYARYPEAADKATCKCPACSAERRLHDRALHPLN